MMGFVCDLLSILIIRLGPVVGEMGMVMLLLMLLLLLERLVLGLGFIFLRGIGMNCVMVIPCGIINITWLK